MKYIFTYTLNALHMLCACSEALLLFIPYNLGLMHLPITKILRDVMRFMCFLMCLYFVLHLITLLRDFGD